ncbi:Fic family protein [Chondromyces crocatus]|uniref:Fic family protein n=1 Tax=Chondromyces crocatus TaxID=52 RepID=UPI001FE0493D|nr:Fic family protein [Chondromyces crocatus]
MAQTRAVKAKKPARQVARRVVRRRAPVVKAVEPRKVLRAPAEKLEQLEKPEKKKKLRSEEGGERVRKVSEAPAAPKSGERVALGSERPEKSSERPVRLKERSAKGSDQGRNGEAGERNSDRPAKNGARSARNSDRPGTRAGRSSSPPARTPVREVPRVVSLPLPMLPPQRRASIEERSLVIEKRLAAQTDEFRNRYYESFDMSWIYHDSALEGVVYTYEELTTALRNETPPADSSLQPTYDDIRRHKEAIAYVRDYGAQKRLPITLDCLRKIYLILHPEEGDIKTVKYRKDIPQHRLYFHEYTPPDKIAYKVRQIADWLNDPETRKTRNGIRIAARAHYDLLRVYPFPVDSGKASRLFMNIILLRAGLPPAIIHSTERQRYYEALKGSATTVLQMVQEAVENALASVEKLLDEHESRKRAFVS